MSSNPMTDNPNIIKEALEEARTWVINDCIRGGMSKKKAENCVFVKKLDAALALIEKSEVMYQVCEDNLWNAERYRDYMLDDDFSYRHDQISPVLVIHLEQSDKAPRPVKEHEAASLKRALIKSQEQSE